jgi:cell division protein FtsA
VSALPKFQEAPRAAALPGARLVAALDIGSSKICCMIGESVATRNKTSDLRQKLVLHGFGHTASRGVNSGAVNNIVEAEKAIRLAVDAAERMAGQSISEVFVGITGGRPHSFCKTGTTEIVSSNVQARDIDNAVTDALSRIHIGSRAILHLAPVSYLLDGVKSALPPIGLHGKRLDVGLGVVTVERAYLRNISAAVERSHLDVLGFVMAPYAAAHGSLVNDEMKLGTILVELGSSLTSVGYFSSGHLVAADVVPLGGAHITSDIAIGLNTDLSHAERMKTLYGSVLQSGHDEREYLPYPILGENSREAIHHVQKRALTSIIRPRSEEILEHVAALLASEAFAGSATARVVLSGGGSALPGIRELASSILGRHARVAEVPALIGSNEISRQPGFAVPVGLLCYALSPDKQYVLPQEAAAAIERQHVGYLRRLGQWFIDAF